MYIYMYSFLFGPLYVCPFACWPAALARWVHTKGGKEIARKGKQMPPRRRLANRRESTHSVLLFVFCIYQRRMLHDVIILV